MAVHHPQHLQQSPNRLSPQRQSPNRLLESKPAAAGDEGKVLNVEVWNDEFINRVTDHYPGYEKVSDTEGKIGDVKVNWIITANQDNAYQNNLDEALAAQADAAADKKVDIFLVEADYALKYVDADADVAMPLKDLGITDADLSKQFSYTQDVVKDANGDLRGSSWQACSAGMIYRRAERERLQSNSFRKRYIPRILQQRIRQVGTGWQGRC